MIRSFKHKGLEKFFKTGKTSGIQPSHAHRIRLVLTHLDQAESATDMDMHNPAHPGEILRDLVIVPLGLTITDVSEHLDVSRKTLSKILNGRGAITPEMALRLELVFRNPSADHWLRLQNAHDLWQARQQKSDFQVQPYRRSTVS